MVNKLRSGLLKANLDLAIVMLVYIINKYVCWIYQWSITIIRLTVMVDVVLAYWYSLRSKAFRSLSFFKASLWSGNGEELESSDFSSMTVHVVFFFLYTIGISGKRTGSANAYYNRISTSIWYVLANSTENLSLPMRFVQSKIYTCTLWDI